MKPKRIIAADSVNNCLTIIGDGAPERITIYTVKKHLQAGDYGIFLTKESAEQMAMHLNAAKHTDAFQVSERILFAI